MPSPAAGVLSGILVSEGETVSVGTELAHIESGDLSGAVTGAEAHVEEPPAETAAEPTPAAPRPAAVLTAQPLQVPAPGAGPGEQAVPMSRLRRATAGQVVESLRASALAWSTAEVDVETVARLIERFGTAFRARQGVALTSLPFVARAVCEALLAFPMVNSEIRGEEIVIRHFVSLGIAVPVGGGIVVPVVKDAGGLTLRGLARAIDDVAQRARDGRLGPDDVLGGTFTITNPGAFGSTLSMPIINPHQTGILALGSEEKRPVVLGHAIAVRRMLYLSMSWDHRLIDGALAAQFLARVKQNLETWDFAEELGG